MVKFEQEQEILQTIREGLKDIIELDPEDLVRREELGTQFNFRDGLPYFKRTIDLFRELADCDLEGVPYQTLTQINKRINEAGGQFKKIQEFKIEGDANPTQTRDQLLTGVADQWHGHWTAITPVITSRKQRSLDLDELQREAKEIISEQRGVANQLKTEADKVLAEMKGALEQVRQAAAEAGVAQHAGLFKSEAASNRKWARAWLGAAGAFALATVGYALVLVPEALKDLPADASVGQTIALTLTKVVILSVLTSGVFWCARNFSALRHNLVVNQHRHNALGTFETFVKAAGDAETKNAVLLQATQAIFGPQATGYSKEDSQPQQQARLLEIFRSVGGATVGKE